MSIVRQFEQLWSSAETPPDVFAFLKQQNVADPDQWLAVLRTDQKKRWETDRPLTVEEYMAGLPNLPRNVDWKLQLAIGESEARRNSNHPLSIQEITSRFPDLSEKFREQAEQHECRYLASEMSELLETVINWQDGPSSTFTYRGGNGIGVQQKGRYRLDRVLGLGGFGERVYLCFDEELHRCVSIKKYYPNAGFQKPQAVEAALAEARTAAGLDHPNIVPVYDVGYDQYGAIYEVSRFIEGATLRERLKAGRPAERESAQLVSAIARALHYAREKGLIHRCLAASRILIDDRSNTPFVGDFELASCEEDYQKQGVIVGIPAYMSPEQARGEGRRRDGRSDIFSMGVILYELLTGTNPFRGGSARETLLHVISKKPKPPRKVFKTVPAELQRVCLKALSKRPYDRYDTPAEFADDLEQWAAATL